MAENTTNHGWTIPTVGGDADSWGQILNDFFDDELDRQVMIEGLLSNRPTADSSTVKFYLATDNNTLYYNDDSSWSVAIESGGGDGGGGTAGRYIHSVQSELTDQSILKIPIPVEDQDSIEVLMWGVQLPDGSVPAGLSVGLLEPDGSFVSSQSTEYNTASPIVSDTNTSGSTQTYYLAVENDTGQDYVLGESIESIEYYFRMQIA